MSQFNSILAHASLVVVLIVTMSSEVCAAIVNCIEASEIHWVAFIPPNPAPPASAPVPPMSDDNGEQIGLTITGLMELALGEFSIFSGSFTGPLFLPPADFNPGNYDIAPSASLVASNMPPVGAIDFAAFGGSLGGLQLTNSGGGLGGGMGGGLGSNGVLSSNSNTNLGVLPGTNVPGGNNSGSNNSSSSSGGFDSSGNNHSSQHPFTPGDNGSPPPSDPPSNPPSDPLNNPGGGTNPPNDPGPTDPPPSNSPSVPEPSSWILFLLSSSVLVRRFRND